MQSVNITTNVVSLHPVHGEVYSIQHYVIKYNIFRKDSILSSGVLSSYSSKPMYVMLNSRTVNRILIISFTQALFNKKGSDKFLKSIHITVEVSGVVLMLNYLS
jgi:hypothetical protein